jgi:hypothetical protein
MAATATAACASCSCGKGSKCRRNKLNGAASGSTTGRAYGSGRSVLWSYDSVQDHTEDGRRFRMLTVIGPVGCSGGFSLAKLKAPLARFTPIAAASGGRFVRISSIALYAEFSPKTSRLRVTGVTWVIKSIWRQFGRRIRLPPIFLGGKTASDRVQLFLGEGHVAPALAWYVDEAWLGCGLRCRRQAGHGDIPD